MNIWMEVTPDEYELPIKVANSGGELARMCGVSSDTVYSSISHYNNRKRKTCKIWKRRRKFVKVVVDDEEERRDKRYML